MAPMLRAHGENCPGILSGALLLKVKHLSTATRMPPMPALCSNVGARGRFGRARRWAGRSAERRVGNECVSTCISRWSPHLLKYTSSLFFLFFFFSFFFFFFF